MTTDNFPELPVFLETNLCAAMQEWSAADAGDAAGEAFEHVVRRFNHELRSYAHAALALSMASQATAELPEIPLSCRDSHEASLKYVEGFEAGRASRAQSEWISVEDRLPEENVPVLVTKDGGHEYIELDIMEEGVWRDWAEYVEHVEIIGGRTSDVKLYTHWAPIPAPATTGETK